MGTWKLLRLALTGLALGLLSWPGSTGAQPSQGARGNDPMARHRPLLQNLERLTASEAPRVSLSSDGYLTFLGAPPANAFSNRGAKSGDPEAAATAFLQRWRANFVNESKSVTFSTTQVKPGSSRSTVRFGQQYGGVSVYGAEIIVQVNASGGVEMVTSDILRDTRWLDEGKVGLTPTLSQDQGIEQAVAQVENAYPGVELTANTPELVIYAPEILDEKGPASLAWVIEVSSIEPGVVKDRVFVDAHSGKVLLRYSLILHAKNRQIYDANNSSADPGSLARSEGGGPTGITDVDLAYDYFGDTYDFYFDEHGRDSIDNAGYTLSATVRYCPGSCPFANAFWNGTRMYFGAGFSAADDVVSHELTHGVTQNESNLEYLNQSGAINESFSDMWGEWVDLTNTGGTDTPEVRWLMGEDVPGFGAIRDMQDPTTFGDPDRMRSPLFYTGSGDNGGVHINSGVGNKLAYLLTDGDTFNGRTITAMGISTTADLMYECQVNLLTSTSNYAGLYNALTQAAINLGLTQAERDNLEQACLAVEIKPLPNSPTDFSAISSSANTDINLSWVNPSGGGFQNVVIRRGTTAFPTDATSGTLVYQGTGTATVDAGLVQDTVYYYSIFGFYGGSSYSYPVHAQATAGQDPPDYFTEQFEATGNDMDNTQVTLTPNGGPDFYRMCVTPALAFPTDPSTGSTITLGDDGSALLSLGGGATVKLYGQSYSSFYVNSNGNITFLLYDFSYDETLSDHFDQPRISALFDDLNPSAGGTVRAQQFSDRAVVTFQNVPEYGVSNQNSFQIEMFFDGTITITFLGVAATDGIVGISEGNGLPSDFMESDMSNSDSDGDGLRNCWEEDNGLDPNDATGNNGAGGDPDGDGLTNIQEQFVGADPQNADTDGDGLNDYNEVFVHGTGVTVWDTDGDGFGDGEEVSGSANPLDNTNYPTTLLWSDFAHAGTETGAYTLPYNTLGEAVNRVSAGGTIRIKGDSADSTSSETPRITKQVRIEAINGAVRVGV